jgi:hypothetical protein
MLTDVFGRAMIAVHTSGRLLMMGLGIGGRNISTTPFGGDLAVLLFAVMMSARDDGVHDEPRSPVRQSSARGAVVPAMPTSIRQGIFVLVKPSVNISFASRARGGRLVRRSSPTAARLVDLGPTTTNVKMIHHPIRQKDVR